MNDSFFFFFFPPPGQCEGGQSMSPRLLTAIRTFYRCRPPPLSLPPPLPNNTLLDTQQFKEPQTVILLQLNLKTPYVLLPFPPSLSFFCFQPKQCLLATPCGGEAEFGSLPLFFPFPSCTGESRRHPTFKGTDRNDCSLSLPLSPSPTRVGLCAIRSCSPLVAPTFASRRRPTKLWSSGDRPKQMGNHLCPLPLSLPPHHWDSLGGGQQSPLFPFPFFSLLLTASAKRSVRKTPPRSAQGTRSHRRPTRHAGALSFSHFSGACGGAERRFLTETTPSKENAEFLFFFPPSSASP